MTSARSAHVGRASPRARLGSSLGDWRAAFTRAFKEFLADDCMGLAQQVAYSSLLAFFPAVIFLVGLLGLVDGYDDLREFLGAVAPGDVLDTIDRLQADSTGATASLAFVDRRGRRRLGRERRDERGDQGRQPRLRPRRDAAVLEDAADRDRARRADRARRPPALFLLIVFGGPLGDGDRGRGGARRRLRAASGRIAALAARVRRHPALLRARLLPGAERDAAQLAVDHARLARRRVIWLALSGLFALYTSLLGLVLEDLRRARERHRAAALAELLRLRAALRRRAERRARPAGGDPRGRRAERRARKPSRRER